MNLPPPAPGAGLAAGMLSGGAGHFLPGRDVARIGRRRLRWPRSITSCGRRPRAVGVRGDADQMTLADAVLDYDQRVDAAQWPSLTNSPCTRRRPHVGFSVAMRLTRMCPDLRMRSRLFSALRGVSRADVHPMCTRVPSHPVHFLGLHVQGEERGPAALARHGQRSLRQCGRRVVLAAYAGGAAEPPTVENAGRARERGFGECLAGRDVSAGEKPVSRFNVIDQQHLALTGVQDDR
jgi:hypothetical protein